MALTEKGLLSRGSEHGKPHQRIESGKASRDETRGELNQRLSAADIPTFEGEVDFEKVKCIAPSLHLSDPEILDRVKYIRENMAKPLPGMMSSHPIMPSLNVQPETP